MIVQDNTRFWLKTMGQLCLIFSPVALALIFVMRFESGSSRALLKFNNISDNSFIINDVLFVFIFASYGVVFIGLALYIKDIIDDLSGYVGRGNVVRRLNTASVGLLFILAALLLVYLVVVSIACIWGIEQLTVHRLILINKALSLAVFGTFLVADVLGWRSKTEQEREFSKSTTAASSTCNKPVNDQLAATKLLKQFSKEVTVFVNVPTLLLNLSIVSFTLYLDNADHLRGMVNLQLHHYVSPSVLLPEQVFYLFLNGVETGAIVCTIVFSQLVYLVIKTKCDLNLRSLRMGE
jgi:hypothetical protein